MLFWRYKFGFFIRLSALNNGVDIDIILEQFIGSGNLVAVVGADFEVQILHFCRYGEGVLISEKYGDSAF